MKREFNKIGRALAKISFNLVCLIVLVFFTNNYAVAQSNPGEPCEPSSDPDEIPCPSNPEPTPIDGGASILIAGGIAYGLKKVYDKRKQNNEADIA